jgi:hypothetical protein
MGSSFSLPQIKAILGFADISIKLLIVSATLLLQLAFKSPPYNSHVIGWLHFGDSTHLLRVRVDTTMGDHIPK